MGRKELKSITHCDDFNGNSNAVSLLFQFLKPDMGVLTGDVYNRKSAKNICYSVSSLLRSYTREIVKEHWFLVVPNILDLHKNWVGL